MRAIFFSSESYYKKNKNKLRSSGIREYVAPHLMGTAA
jgi:hypothetical protein